MSSSGSVLPNLRPGLDSTSSCFLGFIFDNASPGNALVVLGDFRAYNFNHISVVVWCS